MNSGHSPEPDPPSFGRESEGLRATWEQHSAQHLDTYLVAGVEDPRIHPQSILTRALVADTLWPDRFTALIDAELRFGAVLSWLTLALESGADRYELYRDLEERPESLPPFLGSIREELRKAENPEAADYLTQALFYPPAEQPTGLNPLALDIFADLWKAELSRVEADEPLKVIEPACGSANDYRYLHHFGFAPFLEYCGFDLSPKNIANARRRFPAGNFRVADCLETDFGDACVDFCFVHDLFEHLPLPAMERALDEVFRLAGRQLWLHFFNLAVAPDHEVRPVDRHHWNRLSQPLLVRALEDRGAEVEAIRISEWIAAKTGWDDYYNSEAWTLVATK